MSKHKHILFIVENNPVPGDIRVWPEALAVKDYGYEVSVICPKGKMISTKSHEFIENIEIFRHPVPHEGNGFKGIVLEYINAIFWEFIYSVKIYIKKPFHAIHSANPPDHVFIIALLFKAFGVKYIFDHHDLAPEAYVAKFHKKNIIFHILKIMEKCTFKIADIVISTNESYKKVAIERGNKREDKIFVVRNGPHLSKIKKIKPRYEYKNGYKYLVSYVGAIGNQECIDVLLHAIRYIVYEKNIFNVKFAIIGNGPELSALIELSKNLRIQKYVEFTGQLTYEQLGEIVSISDIGVCPEYANEYTNYSTMVKIMDYMAFKKPIVQFYTLEGERTAGKAALYIYEHNEIAFADGIISLLQDEKKRKKMGCVGYMRLVQYYTWEIQKKNLKEAYQNLF